jgi:TRAP-type mannitol/chloroaromatic compound transport system permease small subunit
MGTSRCGMMVSYHAASCVTTIWFFKCSRLRETATWFLTILIAPNQPNAVTRKLLEMVSNVLVTLAWRK